MLYLSLFDIPELRLILFARRFLLHGSYLPIQRIIIWYSSCWKRLIILSNINLMVSLVLFFLVCCLESVNLSCFILLCNGVEGLIFLHNAVEKALFFFVVVWIGLNSFIPFTLVPWYLEIRTVLLC